MLLKFVHHIYEVIIFFITSEKTVAYRITINNNWKLGSVLFHHYDSVPIEGVEVIKKIDDLYTFILFYVDATLTGDNRSEFSSMSACPGSW